MSAKRREEQALDAIVAFILSDLPDREHGPLIDGPNILSEEDHRALEALGSDLVDKLLKKSREVGNND